MPRVAPPPRASGRVWGAALLAGIVVGGAGYPAMPFTGAPDLEMRGDTEPAAAVEDAAAGAESAFQGAGVTLIDGGETATAFGGTTDGEAPIDAATPYETGSVYKVFTAMTLADMVEQGETSLDRTLGEVFPDVGFASEDTASITFEELATHHSGLPTVPGMGPLNGGGNPLAFNNVYADLEPVDEALATVAPTDTRGEWSYSNFGYATLGAALAREAGTEYPDLVRERIFEPLGMEDTGSVGARYDGVPEDGALPHREPGAPVEPWVSPTYAPAGVGTWTTMSDMERFARAVLDGSAPGTAALEPHAQGGYTEDAELGLAWMSLEAENGTVLNVHDGGTYGSSSFLGVDREGGRAVVAYTNTGMAGMPITVGQQLLVGEDVIGSAAMDGLKAPALNRALTLAMVAVPVLLALAFALRRRTLVGQRPMDRMRILSMPLGSFAVVVLALVGGSWASTPPVVWAAALGLMTAAAVVTASYWPKVRWNNARWPWLHYPFFALSVVVSATLIGSSLWAVSTMV